LSAFRPSLRLPARPGSTGTPAFELARKSAALPLPELQASLMLLASDALSKFDGSTAPPASPAQSNRASRTATDQITSVFGTLADIVRE